MDKENKTLILLKTHEVVRQLMRTPLGELTIKRGKDQDTYTYLLDGVVLDKNLQKELDEIWEINSQTKTKGSSKKL